MLVVLARVEQRCDAVIGVIRERLKVTEVAEAYGVSRQSVHSWLARCEAEDYRLWPIEAIDLKPLPSKWTLR